MDWGQSTEDLDGFYQGYADSLEPLRRDTLKLQAIQTDYTQEISSYSEAMLIFRITGPGAGSAQAPPLPLPLPLPLVHRVLDPRFLS